jgi:hypothetical protein
MAMNYYGHMAMEHWQKFLPSRYSQIEDPESFFSTFGEQIGQEIDQLTHSLAGRDQPGEGALKKTGRLKAAEQQAREKILAEQVLLPAEPGSPADESDPDEPDPPAMTAQEDDPASGLREHATDWIPTVVDPNHWYWQMMAEEEDRE